MNSIGAASLRPDALPDVNHMCGIYYSIISNNEKSKEYFSIKEKYLHIIQLLAQIYYIHILLKIELHQTISLHLISKIILYHMGRSSDHNYVKLGSSKYGNEHINITYIKIIVRKQCRATTIIKWTLLVKLL